MLLNYLKISFRNMLKDKLFVGINMLGLAVSFSASILILTYVAFELSFDRHQKNSSALYRVITEIKREGATTKLAKSSPLLGPLLKINYPEIVDFARLLPMDAKTVVSGQNLSGRVAFNEENLFFADNSFLSLFSVPMISGGENLLQDPNTIVISHTISRKYFGGVNPVGRILRINSGALEKDLKVTGVFQDVPANTHLNFDLLISMASLPAEWLQQADQILYYTYLQLAPGTYPESLQAKFPVLVRKYFSKVLDAYQIDITQSIQPLTDIHLFSDLEQEISVNEDAKLIYSLIVVALFILVIGWLNYIIITMAKSSGRAKEVGVRKAVGAEQNQLVKQFLVESVVLNCLAVVLAVGLSYIGLSFFSKMLGKSFDFTSLQYLFSGNAWIGIVSCCLFLAGMLASGLYPALVIASFNPLVALKGRITSNDRRSFFQRALVVVQFSIASALIVGTLVVRKQVEYMRAASQDMNQEKVVILKGPSITGAGYAANLKAFRRDLLQYPIIKSIGATSHIPGDPIIETRVDKASGSQKQINSFQIVGVDNNFIPIMNVSLLEGRNFSESNPIDTNACVLNEMAAQLLGYDKPEEVIGQQVIFWERQWRVVGVLKNFHQSSLKYAFKPMVLVSDNTARSYYLVTLNTRGAADGELKETLAFIQSKWNQQFPGTPFEYFFMEDHLNNLYANEQLFGKTIVLFSGLAIFLACLGLYGLASFSLLRRTKEVGVRKVLGASLVQLVVLLSKDFVVLQIIAYAVSWPIIFYVMRVWLTNFAFRTSIQVSEFMIAGTLIFIISFCTILRKVLQVSTTNPVQSLRTGE